MKTPMQELLDILIEKKRNTLEAPLSDTRVALDFAIEQTRLMLEKEKEVMCELKDLSQEVGFWKRLESFVKNVEVNDAWGYEEKEVILYVCSRKIKEFNTKEK